MGNQTIAQYETTRTLRTANITQTAASRTSTDSLIERLSHLPAELFSLPASLTLPKPSTTKALSSNTKLADSFEEKIEGDVADAGEKITYLYSDALGSTIAKADADNNLIWREDRLPYGKNTQLSTAQIDKDPLQYTDAPLDSHSGLLYLKARYYNPDIGRFYATDPVWFREKYVQTFGRYTYANNNPYRYIDPNGENIITAIGGMLTEAWNYITGQDKEGSIYGALKDGYDSDVVAQ